MHIRNKKGRKEKSKSGKNASRHTRQWKDTRTESREVGKTKAKREEREEVYVDSKSQRNDK